MYKYKAFISYSHEDKAFAKWLHKRIENYKIPKSLREKYPHLPKDLKRSVFRDEEELAIGANLSKKLINALNQSEFLIVITSPNAVASEWVGKEIRYFKSYHGENRVLAIMKEGEPSEAFPKALRYQVDIQGKLTKVKTEPLAGDARNFFGKKRGLIQLIAGILEVDFADLWEREEKRYRRNIFIWSTFITILISFISSLIIYILIMQKSIIDINIQIEKLSNYTKSIDAKSNKGKKTIILLNQKIKKLLKIKKEREDILNKFPFLEKEVVSKNKSSTVNEVRSVISNDKSSIADDASSITPNDKPSIVDDASLATSKDIELVNDENKKKVILSKTKSIDLNLSNSISYVNSSKEISSLNKPHIKNTINTLNQIERNQSSKDLNINSLKIKRILEDKGLISKTTINNEIIRYINDKKNREQIILMLQELNVIYYESEFVEIEKQVKNKIISTLHNSSISYNYLKKITKYPKSYRYGVAISGWNDAKMYCTLLNKHLASKEFYRYRYDEGIKNTEYWTDTEVDTEDEEVYIYVPYSYYNWRDYIKASKNGTYIAHCIDY